MANRVLRRPMFRMGGSPNFEFQEQTSGVLSGLDGPKLNASRTGLKEGGNPNKDIIFPTMEQQMINMGLGAGGGRDMSGIESLGIVEEEKETNTNTGTTDAYLSAREQAEKLFGKQTEEDGITSGMPGSLSSALMTFGLNLLGQPGGNLAGAIGKAGAPALSKFQQARLAERLDKRKSDRERQRDIADLAGDIYVADKEAATDLEKAKIEAASGGDKAFAFKEKFDLVVKTNGEIDDLQIQIDSETDPEKKKTLEKQLKGKQEGLKTIAESDEFLGGFYKSDYFKDQIDQAASALEVELGRPPTVEEIRERVLGTGNMANGGRAGYQMGGDVVEDVSMMSETETISPTAPAQTQDLTYDELRSRLPREITNDVVSLIATSKQALTDFANIQTQQDVDNFNQTYNVNLVLPQEG
jgi:hypothetical protein